MPDKTEKIKLSLEFDESTQSKIDAGVGKIESRLNSLENATTRAGDAFPKTARSTELFLQGLNKAAEAARNYEENIAGAVEETEKLKNSQRGMGEGGVGNLGLMGLRRTGSALSQLGATGAGQTLQLAGDVGQIGKQLGQVSSTLEEAGGAAEKAAPLVGGIGTAIAAVVPAGLVFIGGLELIKQTYKDTGRAAEEAVSRLNTYYDALATGDSKNIANKLKSLELQKEYSDKELEVLKAAKEKGFDAAQKAYGDLGARILSGLGATGLYGDGIKKIDDRITELTKSSDDLTGQIDGLKDAMNSAEVQASQLADAILQNASDIAKNEAERQADAALSVDAAKKKLEAQQNQLEQDLLERDALVASGDQSQKVQDRIKELNKEIGKTSDEIDNLRNNIIPAAEATQKLSDAVKEHTKTLDDANKAAVEAAKAEEKKRADTASAVQKYDDDVTKITQAGIQGRLDIEHKYQDTLVQIATKAAQQAADDLEKLKEERQKISIDANRAELDAASKARYDDYTNQIKAQEEEQKATIDHQRKLEDIRAQARQREAGFILDRNFLGLFQSQMQTRTDMQNENTAFGRGAQDRSISRQQQAQDDARQREFEHQQRLISYQRQNEDALRNYELQRQREIVVQQRERQAALVAERTNLVDLQNKITSELTLRRQGIVAELKLIQMGEEQKLQIQKRYLDQAVALLSGRSGGYSAPTSGARSVQVNQTYHVNNVDPQALAQANAMQAMQLLRHVTGAGV